MVTVWSDMTFMEVYQTIAEAIATQRANRINKMIAKSFLVFFIRNMTQILDEEWTSFGRCIHAPTERAGNIVRCSQILDIFTVPGDRKMLNGYDIPEQWTQLVQILVIAHRISLAKNQTYRNSLHENLQVWLNGMGYTYWTIEQLYHWQCGCNLILTIERY